jgi:hypothetical protein
MAVQALKTNGTRGEVTPLAVDRADTEFFKAATKTLRNWVVLRYGGFRRRSGSRYRGSTKIPGSESTFIPFVFSSTQAYMLEFGHQYIRFWTPDGQRVMNGSSPYEIATSYSAADVERIQFAQANDVMYLAHPLYAPAKLSRLAHTNWTIANVDFLDGPYLPINDTPTTLTPSASPSTGATITLTASAVTNINGSTGFQTTDVGRLIRFQIGGSWSWGTITARASTTQISVFVRFGGGGGTTASASWRLGAYSSATGAPGSVSFTDGRLCWGRTNANPNGIGISRSGLPEVYSPSAVDGTVTDSHGMFYDIFNAGEIQWLQESPSRLQIGTYTAIRTLGASSGDEVLAPRNVSQKLESNSGTTNVLPARIGPSTVHAGRYGRTLRDLFYDYNINSLTAPSLSTLSEHMFKRGIRRLAFAQEPDSVLWGVTKNGVLFGTTFDRDERVIGFHRHPMTNGFVECVASVPDATNERDSVFLIVRRVINGSTVRYVETLDPLFDNELTAKEDACFVDCAATYSGTAVGTVTGLGHLEGQTVDVYADGCVLPQRVVTGGAVTLANGRTAEKITVGLPIDDYGETLQPVVEKPNGSAVNDKQRTMFVIVNEYETLGLKVGTPGQLRETVRFRPNATPMGQTPDLHSGKVRVPVESSWETNGAVCFSVGQPLPATILSLNIGVET